MQSQKSSQTSVKNELNIAPLEAQKAIKIPISKPIDQDTLERLQETLMQ